MAAACVAVGLFAAPAFGKSLNGFVGGQGGVNHAGLFTQPRDVAVYTAGDADPTNDKILVVEGFHGATNRLQRLDVHGNVELMWGGDVVVRNAPGDTGTGFEVCDPGVSGVEGCQRGLRGDQPGMFDDPMAIAVDQSTGAVYVADRDNRRVQQFDLDGTFVREFGSAELGATSVDGVGLAVSPADGDVFVADPANRRVLRFNSDGTPDGSEAAFGSATEFASGYPRGLAVDANGVVYASDATGGTNRVVRYDTDTGSFLDPLDGLLTAGVTKGLEVDPATGNLLVARQQAHPGSPVVDEVADPDAPLPPGGPPNPTVVDTHVFDTESPSNPLLVHGLGYNPSDGNIYLAAPALFLPPSGIFNGCEQVKPTSLLYCAGLIVLADGGVPSASGVVAGEAGVSSVAVSGLADTNGGVGRWVFELSTDGATWDEWSAVRYGSGSGAGPVSAVLSGLEPNTSYRLRLRVFKQIGMDEQASVVSDEVVFLTDAKAPEVETLGSADRTATGVTLRGRVDPEGAHTSYRFEWGPAGGSFDHHIPVPDGSAGAGNRPVVVTQRLEGLLADTAYHYRLVAENFVDQAAGSPVEFTTRPDTAGPPGLEGRGYEMVSPPYKVGGQGVGEWYTGIDSHEPVGFSAYDGERFLLTGLLGVVLVDGAYSFGSDAAFAQRTGSGWQTAPAVTRRAHCRHRSRTVTPIGSNQDLSVTLWDSNGGRLRLFEEMCEWPDNPSIYARDELGRWETLGPTDPAQGIAPLGERVVLADGSGVVGSSSLRGLAGPDDPGLASLPGTSHVYRFDFAAGGLSDSFPGLMDRSVVNVCEGGTVVPQRLASGLASERGCADGELVDLRGGTLGGLNDIANERAVSRDGGRVFFMSPDPRFGANNNPCSGTGAATACPPQLYVRQRMPDGGFVTRWISRSEVAGQEASLLAPVSFEGASWDGDKVLFRTTAPLTADDPNGATPGSGPVTSGTPDPLSADLFVYDMPDDPAADPADGELTRISAGPTGDADVNVTSEGDEGRSGAVRFVSDGGSRVYFASAAPLEGVDVPGSGTVAFAAGERSSADAVNLYLYDANGQGADRWRFIARLPRTSPVGGCASVQSGASSGLGAGQLAGELRFVGGNCVRGSADGSFIVFWTDGRLTGDDPDSVSGDIYGYDADRDELTRLSAPQGGAGGSYPCAPIWSSARCYGDPGFGRSKPGALALSVASTPSVAGDRLAFFESRSRLVPADTDDAYDVYQWRNGELSLISTGKSEGDGAFYQGNDRSGDSVFLSTRDRLTWQDVDDVVDVYVARVGGGIAPPPPPPVCGVLSDGCQGAGPGAVAVPVQSNSPAADGNATPRRPLVARVGRRARRLAARRGVLAVAVRAPEAGRVRAVARARLGRRVRSVGRGGRRVSAGERAVVRVRLARPVRRRLVRGRRMRLAVVVRMRGMRAVRQTVALNGRGGRLGRR